MRFSLVLGPVAALASALFLTVAPSAAQERWIQGPALPEPRSEIQSVPLDGRIYVTGGLDTAGVSDAFLALDPQAGRWTRLAAMPERLHHVGFAALDGRLYLTGGYRDLLFTAPSDKAYAYDPATDAWSPVAPMPGGRAAHVMVPAQGRLYVIGGVGDDPEAVWVYDPSRDRWSVSDAPLPMPREHAAAVLIDDSIHVVAGRWNGRNLGTVEALDLGTGQWRRLPDLPTPRSGLTAGVLGGRVHVAGGEEFEPNRTFDAHEIYDPAARAWTAGAPLPMPLHGLASAEHEGRWYVIGGASGAGWGTFGTQVGSVLMLDPGKR